MVRSERPAAEWFAEAARCYVEGHQGCAWCRGSYRVFQRQRGTWTEYHCNGCDFRTGRDAATKEYYAIPGEDVPGMAPVTMLEL